MSVVHKVDLEDLPVWSDGRELEICLNGKILEVMILKDERIFINVTFGFI